MSRTPVTVTALDLLATEVAFLRRKVKRLEADRKRHERNMETMDGLMDKMAAECNRLRARSDPTF